MNHQNFRRSLLATAVGGALLALSSQVSASAFSLAETNAAGLGRAFAGGATAAEDASAMFDNPAAMAKVKADRQVVVAGELISVGFKFKSDGCTPRAGGLGAGTGPYLQGCGSGDGDGSTLNPVPNTFIMVPLNDQVRFGLAITAPFGLKTDYSPNWEGRFHGTLSDIKTINLNPSVSYKPTESVSLGLGLNFQAIKAELRNQVNAAAVVASGAQSLVAAGRLPAAALPGVLAAANGLEGDVKIKGDDTSWGWNAGVMFDVGPQTRLSFAYRSEIKYNLEGDVNFGVPTSNNAVAAQVLAAARQSVLADGGIKLDIKMPSSFVGAWSHQVNPQLTLVGDVTWFKWSNIKELRIMRTNGQLLQVEDYSWKDAWRVAFGGMYQLNDQLLLRAGTMYDQTPTKDETRNVRLPDNDRLWFSFGARYTLSKALSFDAGYSYLYIKQPKLHKTEAPANGMLSGKYDANIHIIGVQMNYNF